MPGSPRKRERTGRWLELAQDPGTLRALCDHVAEGGSLPEWCRTHDVRFADVNAWLTADDRRAELYGAARLARDEFLSELVIRNLRQMAEADWREAYDEKGNLRSFTDWPEGLRRAVLSVEFDDALEKKGKQTKLTRTISKVRYVAPDRAIELLGKYRRMFVERREFEGTLKLEDLVGGSMAGGDGAGMDTDLHDAALQPTLSEQIAAVRDEISSLRRSYTEADGKIRDSYALRQIRVLQVAVLNLRRLRGDRVPAGE